MSNIVTGVSMDSQKRSITVRGYFDVYGRVIKENLVKRHPELTGHVLNVIPGIGRVRIDNHSGVFPAGAEATLAEILEPYRKPAPIKITMPVVLGRGRKSSIKPMLKEWVR